MKTLNVYLFFNGNCEEAMNYYKKCLGGEIVSVMSFGESNMPIPEEAKNRIMHAELKADNIYIMASDGTPDKQVTIGDNYSLSINCTSEEEQENVFNKLVSGGKVTMPLQDTFWGAKFGMLTDKFGINWILNFNKRTHNKN